MQGHSWGDVHATLVHMMSSEWVWMQRWHGKSPKGHLDQGRVTRRWQSLKKRWAEVEAEMRGVHRGADGRRACRSVITYSNFSGETFRVPLWQMLAHIVNHETHHRGELAAMYALMGVAHPEEEMIQYFLNASGQKKF